MSPSYTKEDMKVLARMSKQGSIPSVILAESDYDPEALRKTLRDYHLKKDIYYLFEAPLGEVPLLMDKGHLAGYVRFRMAVGK